MSLSDEERRFFEERKRITAEALKKAQAEAAAKEAGYKVVIDYTFENNKARAAEALRKAQADAAARKAEAERLARLEIKAKNDAADFAAANRITEETKTKAKQEADNKLSPFDVWAKAVDSGKATESDFQTALGVRASRVSVATINWDKAFAAAQGVQPGGSREVPTEGEKQINQLRYKAAESDALDTWRGLGFGGVSESTAPTDAQIQAQQNVGLAWLMGFGSGGVSERYPTEGMKATQQEKEKARLTDSSAKVDAERRQALLEMGFDVDPNLSQAQGAADVEAGITQLKEYAKALDAPFFAIEANLYGAMQTQRAASEALGLFEGEPEAWSDADLARKAALADMDVSDVSATEGDAKSMYAGALTFATGLGVFSGYTFAFRPAQWINMIEGGVSVARDPGGAWDTALNGPIDKATGERIGPGVLSVGELPFTFATLIGGVIGGKLFSSSVAKAQDVLSGKQLSLETLEGIYIKKVADVTDLPGASAKGPKALLLEGETLLEGEIMPTSAFKVTPKISTEKLPEGFPLWEKSLELTPADFDVIYGLADEGMGTKSPMQLFGIDPKKAFTEKFWFVDDLKSEFQGVAGETESFSRFADVGKNSLTGEPNIFMAKAGSLDIWKEVGSGSLWDEAKGGVKLGGEGFTFKVIGGSKLPSVVAETAPFSKPGGTLPSMWKAWSQQYPTLAEQLKAATEAGKGPEFGFGKWLSSGGRTELLQTDLLNVAGATTISHIVQTSRVVPSFAGVGAMGAVITVSRPLFVTKPTLDTEPVFGIKSAFTPKLVLDTKPTTVSKPVFDVKPVIDVKPVFDTRQITIIEPIIIPPFTPFYIPPPGSPKRGIFKPLLSKPLKGRGSKSRFKKGITSVGVPEAEAILFAFGGKKRHKK